MYKFHISTLFFFCCHLAFSQCPVGQLLLDTQQKVDDFNINFPNCTQLTGELRIQGSDITNLNGLSQLTHLNGGLLLLGPSNLQSLNGLNNVSRITGVSVLGCDSLSDLSGLDNLIIIDGQLQIESNIGLLSLNGLEQLDTIAGQLFIYNNSSLANIFALNNLKHINGSLFITICPNLSQCEATGICDYLDSPSGTIFIDFNGPGCDNQTEVENACINCIVQNTWVGSSIGFWHQSSNWSLNEIPTDCHHVIIPSGNEVIIDSNTDAQAYLLEVHQGAIFSTETNTTLEVVADGN